jgi:hypothetical protein
LPSRWPRRLQWNAPVLGEPRSMLHGQARMAV